MNTEVELFLQFLGQLTVLAGLYTAGSEICQGARESFKNYLARRQWRKRNAY